MNDHAAALADSRAQNDTEAMLAAVEAAYEVLATYGLCVVLERAGDDATAHVILLDHPNGPTRLTSRAGNGWRDALRRALAWCGV